MIIYSVTTAMEESIEGKWVDFMKISHISLIMKTGCFVDYRFVRIISGEGQDISYNLQLRCKSHAQLTDFRSKHELVLEKIIQSNFEGKYATFQSVLEQVSESSSK
jgi:hypothetical protein